jgi:hypothetical protein
MNPVIVDIGIAVAIVVATIIVITMAKWAIAAMAKLGQN